MTASLARRHCLKPDNLFYCTREGRIVRFCLFGLPSLRTVRKGVSRGMSKDRVWPEVPSHRPDCEPGGRDALEERLTREYASLGREVAEGEGSSRAFAQAYGERLDAIRELLGRIEALDGVEERADSATPGAAEEVPSPPEGGEEPSPSPASDEDVSVPHPEGAAAAVPGAPPESPARYCPRCGVEYPSSMSFCMDCGVRLVDRVAPEAVPARTPYEPTALVPGASGSARPTTAPAPAVPPAARTCPSCGATLREGDVFCGWCGRRLIP